eukprot:Skav231781  [mRNA]  locus=scaffold3283:172552:172998:+ [translate_table: standard]
MTQKSSKTLKFTKVCKHWRANGCQKGSDCQFAHSSQELGEPPLVLAAKLCSAFKHQCGKGSPCSLVHGRDELRAKIKVPTAYLSDVLSEVQAKLNQFATSSPDPILEEPTSSRSMLPDTSCSDSMTSSSPSSSPQGGESQSFSPVTPL